MSLNNSIAVWKVRDYRRLWFTGLLTSSCRWLEIMCFSVITWQWFGDPRFATALFAIRMLALSLTGMIFSIFPSKIPGQKVMFWTQILVATSCFFSAICFFYLTSFRLYSLFVLSAFSGSLWSVDWSCRRRMLADTLDRNLVFSGLSLDVMSSHATRFLGVFLGGALLYRFQDGTLLLILSIAYTLASFIIVTVDDKSFKSLTNKNLIVTAKCVFKQAGNSFPILSVLLITPIFNVFVLPFVALVPLLFIEKFYTGEFLTGFLTSFDGIGAIFGSVIISALVLKKPIKLFFVFITMLLFLLFGLTLVSNLILMAFFLFLVGALSSIYSTLQSSIIYNYSATGLRPATFSILTITIGSGFLGGLNTSWLGGFLDVSGVIMVISIEGFFAFILALVFLNSKFNGIYKSILTKK